MQERRKYIRIKPSKPVRVKFKIIPRKRHKITLARGKTSPKDIGGGGMFIELPFMKPKIMEDLSSGKDMIALELKVPGYTHTIKMLSKVIWTDKKESLQHRRCGMGIEFEGIGEEDRERLLQYMLQVILQ